MQEEFVTTNMSIQKCDFVAQELSHRPIEVAQRMIEFMNSAAKLDLKFWKWKIGQP